MTESISLPALLCITVSHFKLSSLKMIISVQTSLLLHSHSPDVLADGGGFVALLQDYVGHTRLSQKSIKTVNNLSGDIHPIRSPRPGSLEVGLTSLSGLSGHVRRVTHQNIHTSLQPLQAPHSLRPHHLHPGLVDPGRGPGGQTGLAVNISEKTVAGGQLEAN